MRYNTVVCEAESLTQQVNGNYVLEGRIAAALGDDYAVGEQGRFLIPQSKAEYLDEAKPGTYLLERVDGESGHCAFPSLVRDGKSAVPAWIGPLQAAWQEDGKYRFVTLDRSGREGDALAQAAEAVRKHAGSLRVFRDIVEIDDDGMPKGSMEVSAKRWQEAVAGLIEDFPDMTGVIVRDGERATMARLKWDGESQTRHLVPPTLRDGTPLSFRKDTVEILPVFQVNYLTNRFNPKKSTAITMLQREIGKTDKQQAFEEKLYRDRGTFAAGVALVRDLPSGGRTLEQVAAGFPAVNYRQLPGTRPLPDATQAPRNSAAEASGPSLRDPAAVLRSLGIPEEQIGTVLAMAKNNTSGEAPKGGLQSAQQSARPAGADHPAPTQEPAQERMAASAPPKSPSVPPQAPEPQQQADVRTAPKVTFGRKR